MTISDRKTTAMHLRHLPDEEVRKAYDAAGYLLGLDVRMDRELAIKLDTFRADVMAELEERPVDLSAHRAARAAGE
ncbi:MAG: hypothetical protein ACRDNF_15290 [Streptosporangiaceae bacterium]